MLLVAVLTVDAAKVDEYRTYEGTAYKIMARYGGSIERVLVLPGDSETFRELHIVSFPDDAAYQAYMVDGERTELAPTRARCVRSTEIWPAEEGPRY